MDIAASLSSDTTPSLLDNPIWHALSTRQAAFSEGDDFAKRYPVAVAPLAATRDQSAESYDSLAKLLGPGGQAGLTLNALPAFPAGWTVVHALGLAQMVWTNLVAPPVEHGIEDLNISNIQEMLTLAELTKPGPFGKRTPELGSYIGIRNASQMVAMAGERLRLPGYTEISAVCTHPEHRGRGYASSLVAALIRRITRRGETPFLHVATENVNAIHVYEKLDFKTRRIINLAIVRRE